eukprot:1181532-Prorocentrum_minimum.AAC.4
MTPRELRTRVVASLGCTACTYLLHKIVAELKPFFEGVDLVQALLAEEIFCASDYCFQNALQNTTSPPYSRFQRSEICSTMSYLNHPSFFHSFAISKRTWSSTSKGLQSAMDRGVCKATASQDVFAGHKALQQPFVLRTCQQAEGGCFGNGGWKDLMRRYGLVGRISELQRIDSPDFRQTWIKCRYPVLDLRSIAKEITHCSISR